MASAGEIIEPIEGWKVWGHLDRVRTLKQAAIGGPGHAYILAGLPKVGKSLLATEFARALICASPSAPGVPCRTCSTCGRVARGTMPDLSVFSLASQAALEKESARTSSLSIATVRAISASLAYRPLEAPYRVVIVEDVETMQETAQEAFLKTLEEPPSYAVIVLVTSDIDRLLPTIQSRCRSLNVGTVSERIIAERLVAGGMAAEPASTLAELSGGSIGWAIEAAADASLAERRLEVRRSSTALVEADPFERVVTAIRLADGFSKDRSEVLGILADVMSVWRTKLCEAVAEGADTRWGVRAIRAVETCRDDLEANVRPRAALLAMVSAWPSNETS